MLRSLLLAAVVATLALSCVATDRPIQQRIALLPDGMTVSWSTESPLDGPPQAFYGLSPNSLTSSAHGFSAHYDSSTTYFHHVELHGLMANTTYYWQVNATTKPSPTLSFMTQPAMKTADDGKFSVAIYGDLGIDNSVDTLRLMRRIARNKEVELFWHVRDTAGHITPPTATQRTAIHPLTLFPLVVCCVLCC